MFIPTNIWIKTLAISIGYSERAHAHVFVRSKTILYLTCLYVT